MLMCFLKRRKYTSTEESHAATMKNFTQYRLNGMIGGLSQIYYERRSESSDLLNQIGLCIDCLNELKEKFKELDYDN